jgi:hypothetical protein
MNNIKILLSGLLIGLLNLIVGVGSSFIVNPLIPTIQQEYQNPNIFRPWSDPLMLLYFLHPFVLGIMLALVWDKVNKIVEGRTLLAKGIRFGFYVWLVSTIPGMLISYSSFQLSFMMIASWSISGLLQVVIAGIVLAVLNKGKEK